MRERRNRYIPGGPGPLVGVTVAGSRSVLGGGWGKRPIPGSAHLQAWGSPLSPQRVPLSWGCLCRSSFTSPETAGSPGLVGASWAISHLLPLSHPSPQTHTSPSELLLTCPPAQKAVWEVDVPAALHPEAPERECRPTPGA